MLFASRGLRRWLDRRRVGYWGRSGRVFRRRLRAKRAVLLLLELLDEQSESPEVHLFERAIGDGMREQVLRPFEQVGVLLRSGELVRTMRRISRFVRCLATARSWWWFSSVRCGASITTAVRCSSPSMDTAILDFREVRQQLGEELVGATDQTARVASNSPSATWSTRYARSASRVVPVMSDRIHPRFARSLVARSRQIAGANEVSLGNASKARVRGVVGP